MEGDRVREKSYAFALRVIALYRELQAQHEYVLSKQVLRCGTSIGANIEEATAAQSRNDFIAKMSVASKEARETKYWLRLLKDSKLTTVDISPYIPQIDELIRMLTSIVKTTSETRDPARTEQAKQ
jgi:four helix bundle protein